MCNCFSFSTVRTRVGLPFTELENFPLVLLYESDSLSESVKNYRLQFKHYMYPVESALKYTHRISNVRSRNSRGLEIVKLHICGNHKI
jgi:hypothetical protein